jgi:hypothetical protein
VRIRSFFAALGLISFFLVAACGDNYLAGEGESCSSEGWVGGHGVCAQGLVCSDLDNWTCRPRGSSWDGTIGDYPGASIVRDAASDASDAGDAGDVGDAGDAGSDGEKDAGISGLDGG